MENFVQYGLAVVSVLLVVGFLKRMLIPSAKKYPPGPHGYPLLGHVPQYGAFPPKTFMKWWHRYGDVFSIRLGSWKAVGVNGYSTIKEVTNHPNDAFAGRPYFVSHEVMEEVVGASTLSSGNYCPAYIKHHQVVSRSLKLFSTGRQEVMEELVSQETNALIDKLLKNCGTIPGYVLEDVMNCFLRVTFQFLYGRGQNIDQHVQTIHDCIQEFVEFCNNGSAIDVMPWLKYFMPGKVNWLRNILGKMYRLQKEQIEEHKTDFTKEDIRDVADAFIASDVNDDNGVLSRTKLNGALVDLMAASYDTTSSTIAWMLLHIAAYPDVQRKVHEEIDELVKGRKVSLKDKKNLPYVEAVFLEVSRMVPPLPFALPHYAIMDAKIGDYDVDKDTVVILNYYSVHYDEKYWGDPDNFRPERFFTKENTLDSDKCAHVLQFGTGRRKCIGDVIAKMNVFLSFATIMQRCNFIKPSGEELDLNPVPGLVYHPKDFRVLVKERV
ncbi:cytochrome P450 1 subfamily A member 2 [Mactra antiquata]